MHSDEAIRNSEDSSQKVTDWDQELAEIRALYEPVSKLPPKRPASASKHIPKWEKARPAYQAMTQLDRAISEQESFFSRHKAVWLMLLFAGILALLAGVLYFAISNLNNSVDKEPRILSRVTIGSMDVGGMTAAEAEQALSAQFGQWQMTVSINGTELVLSSARLDISAAVEEAMRYGHEGSAIKQLEAWTGSHTVELLPYFQLNQEDIRSQLNELEASFRPSSYSLSGNVPALGTDTCSADTPLPSLVLDLGCTGQSLDIDGVLDQILAACNLGLAHVDAAAETSIQQPEALNLDAIHEAVCILPTTESYGIDFDLAGAKALLASAHPGDVFRIPMRLVQPLDANVSAEFPDVLASFDTPHNQDPMRNHNIALVCQMLDGYVIQPGAVFSFNEAVGERTNERGFLSASVYSNYHYAQPLGGGLIQNTTTLYLCALLADLEILERENAQYQPGFVDSGYDADIGWPGPDLKFRNNTDHPIKIVCHNEEEVLYTQLLGTDNRGYYVELEREVSQFESATVYQDVPAGTYTDGQIIQYGSNGAYVQTYICKYSTQTGERMERVPADSSSYPNNNTIIARVVPQENES